ncbi:hypothetical protein D018_4033B, partial [Vibrio parahaemolyticus VP2007-007]
SVAAFKGLVILPFSIKYASRTAKLNSPVPG